MNNPIDERAADDLAEAMFDLVHQNCQDECREGGQPWYRQVARRLVDPASAVASIAQGQQILLDEAAEDSRPLARTTDAWTTTLGALVGALPRVPQDELPTFVSRLGGAVAVYLDQLLES